MNKKLRKIYNHVIDRLNFKRNYIVANVIKKRKVDSENNCFDIMSDKELVNEIIMKKKGLARFGDGELSLILEKKFDLNFQENSLELSSKLLEILNSNIDNLIIGINASFNNPNMYNKKTIRNCRTFNYLYRNKLKQIIPLDRTYGNSSITRFYIDYENKDLSDAYKRLNNLKRIWDKRSLLIVEGIHTKLGVGNDLFDNSKNIRRILIPETNAFSRYEEIINITLKNIRNDELVLLAAGPTATICAYELAKKNIQAIDVGHIDIEYEWLLERTKKRIPVKGKYVNEIKGNKYIESVEENTEYEESIICNIL